MSVSGSCYCGAVKVTCTGEPKVMAECHCRSCAKVRRLLKSMSLFVSAKYSPNDLHDPFPLARQWGSINLATLYPCDQVKVEGDLVEFTNPPPEGKPKGSNRKTCAKCHSNVLNDHPDTMGLTDIVSGILEQEFKPAMHINYAEATWKVNDDLPKFADVPTDFGGSGKMLDNAGNPIASP